MDAVIGRRALLDALDVLLAELKYSVHLYVTDFTPTVDTPLASLIEATYPGYPAGGVTPTLPTVGTLGAECAMSVASVSFPPPSSGGVQLIYGWYVVYQPVYSSVPPAMLMAARFRAAPKLLAVGDPPLPIVLSLRSRGR